MTHNAKLQKLIPTIAALTPRGSLALTSQITEVIHMQTPKRSNQQVTRQINLRLENTNYHEIRLVLLFQIGGNRLTDTARCADYWCTPKQIAKLT